MDRTDQRPVQGAAHPLGPVHEGVPYTDPQDLARELAGPLAEALAAGEAVFAALDAPTRAALGAELGSAADAVDWLDPGDVHRVPAFTVATRWARLSRRSTDPARRTTVVAQQVRLPEVDPGHWVRLDAALNVALADLPVTVLCPCPADADLALLEATHPALRRGGISHPTPALRDPAGVVADFPPPPPPDLGLPLAELGFGAAELPAVRRLVSATAPETGLDPERTADLVLSVNEIATNSVEHGPGRGRLRLWSRPDGLLAEVYDVGRMSVPFPGLVAPSPAGERGRGLWLASELSDVLQVWSDASGTTVRLQVDRS